MFKSIYAVMALGLFAVAGCASSSGGRDLTRAEVPVAVTANGRASSVVSSLSQEIGEALFLPQLNGGIAHVSGFDGTSQVVGLAGIIPGTNVGPVIPSGRVVMGGAYSLTHAKEVEETSGGGIKTLRTTRPVRGPIILTADVAAGTVRGTAGDFTVNGTMSGTSLGGGVTYLGVLGKLTGAVGQRGLAGAFAGETADQVIAGGIVALPIP